MSPGAGEDVEKILRQRARALARPPADPIVEAVSDMAVLEVAGERYALEVSYIAGVLPSVPVTPVPNIPAVWAGLINVRGRIYAVLDLVRYLELSGAIPEDAGRLVLIASGHATIAVLVDAVSQIRSVTLSDVRPPVSRAPGRTPVVKGVTPDMVAILDPEVMLDDPRLSATADLTQEKGGEG